MSKMIQIRHVPDALHRKLKARAATQGISLSDYIKRELKLIAEQPTLDEWFERVSKHKPVILPVSAAELVRGSGGTRTVLNLADAIIAATALQHDLTLVTYSTSLRRVEQLKLYPQPVGG